MSLNGDMAAREVRLAYAEEGLALRVPAHADVLAGADPTPLDDPAAAVAAALARPIEAPPLAELARARAPRRVAIAISDATRPVPNRLLLPPVLSALGAAGIRDAQVTLVIGTGMHRPSTEEERLRLLGPELLGRVRVVDHLSEAAETMIELSRDPPLRICRCFAEADLRIVTGLIEPHFMAGFSGGAKGVCPALVDLETIRAFHSYATLADPRADCGVLEGNPCQAIAHEVAGRVGVDFLLNAAITRDRRLCGVYAGDLRAAHAAGCAQVAAWTGVEVSRPYDLVITSGGGLPLDHTFYQTVKGMVAALPALAGSSTLLTVSGCSEGLGSPAYATILRRWQKDWRGFLHALAARPGVTERDQWELQMQCRVLSRIGVERLWLASDGLRTEEQTILALTPLLGDGDARARAQRAVDALVGERPGLSVAVIPDGPYTLLRRRAA